LNKKKEVIPIFMFSIDLTDDSIRAICVNGRLARDPSKVCLIRTWKCCV